MEGRENKKIIVGVYKQNDCGIVKLEDNGCGMSSDDKEKVFEVLYTTKPKGWGIGLNMVQMLVENHDGHIWCDSELDKGTTFFISFPMADLAVVEGDPI